ncbi:hypothetical protein YC2023_009017 [Brassica napus]
MVTNAETRKSVRKAAHGLLWLSERLPCLLLARLSVGFSQTIYQTSKSGREPQRVSKGAQEDDCLESLRKTRPDKELAEKMGKPGQTEITLKNDLPERDRIDLYKTILALLSNRRGNKNPVRRPDHNKERRLRVLASESAWWDPWINFERNSQHSRRFSRAGVQATSCSDSS